jgi:hypothetical protein
MVCSLSIYRTIFTKVRAHGLDTLDHPMTSMRPTCSPGCQTNGREWLIHMNPPDQVLDPTIWFLCHLFCQLILKNGWIPLYPPQNILYHTNVSFRHVKSTGACWSSPFSFGYVGPFSAWLYLLASYKCRAFLTMGAMDYPNASFTVPPASFWHIVDLMGLLTTVRSFGSIPWQLRRSKLFAHITSHHADAGDVWGWRAPFGSTTYYLGTPMYNLMLSCMFLT